MDILCIVLELFTDLVLEPAFDFFGFLGLTGAQNAVEGFYDLLSSGLNCN